MSSSSPSIRLVIVAGCAMVFTACGGGSGASTASSTVAATVAATDPPASITQPPTTTVADMSRDAVLAVSRCADQFGFLFAEQVSIDESYLTAAQDVCDEATLQVDIEPAAPAGLLDALRLLAVDLAIANLDVVMGEFTVSAQDKLQVAVDVFTAAYG